MRIGDSPDPELAAALKEVGGKLTATLTEAFPTYGFVLLIFPDRGADTFYVTSNASRTEAAEAMMTFIEQAAEPSGDLKKE
jgi:hypothetical protein